MSETSTPTPTTEPSGSSRGARSRWNPEYYEMELRVEEKLQSLPPLMVYRLGIDPIMDTGILVPETWGGPPDELGKIMLDLMFNERSNTLNARARKVLREILRHSSLGNDANQMVEVMCRVASGWLLEYAADLRATAHEDQEA